MAARRLHRPARRSRRFDKREFRGVRGRVRAPDDRFETRGRSYQGHDFRHARRPPSRAKRAVERRIAARPRVLPGVVRGPVRDRDRSAQRGPRAARDSGRGAHRSRLDHGVPRRRSACSSSAAACCPTRPSSRASSAFRRSSRSRRHALAAGRRLGRDGRQHRRRPADVTPEAGRCVAKRPTRADFSAIRYAQVWEDADVLLAGARRPAGRRLRLDRVGRRQRPGAADEQPSRVDRARPERCAARLPRAACRRVSRR